MTLYKSTNFRLVHIESISIRQTTGVENIDGKDDNASNSVFPKAFLPKSRDCVENLFLLPRFLSFEIPPI